MQLEFEFEKIELEEKQELKPDKDEGGQSNL